MTYAANPKFAVGQPVSRTEDPKLVRGAGRFTDDINLPTQLYAVFARSPHAHGVIRGIDIAAARAMPGVLGVFIGTDIEAGGFGRMPCGLTAPNRDGSAMVKPSRVALAVDKVRFVGDPVAVVVAETAAQARDAAEAVVLDLDPLQAVTTAESAMAANAPRIHDEAIGNVFLDYHYGDTAKVAAAFAQAAHVTQLDLCSNRIAVSPMEPRCAAGQYDDGQWTLHVGCQGPFATRNTLAREILKAAPDKVRVITGNVGGSFGMKAPLYPEYVAVLFAARALGRPVKWANDRSESFLSDGHGRDHQMHAELALDRDGNFLAVRITGTGNLGAYPGQATVIPASANVVKNIIGVYRTPLLEVSTKCVFTNTAPVGAYRGAGRPEANYYMERLVDQAAREMGIDRVELRRRNHIPADLMPYGTPSGQTYDSGEFTAVLDKALLFADWNGFEDRKRESERRGLLRGRGIGQYLEVTAPPASEMCSIRFETGGNITLTTGTLDQGQGHATPFAQVAAQRLGVPFERIALRQGDSDDLKAGGGTGGSKSMVSAGKAIVEACDKVVAQGRQIAAFVLNASEGEITFNDGRFAVEGQADRNLGIGDLLEVIGGGLPLPAHLPQSLDVEHIAQTPPSTFPNGCHIAEVEIDPATGVVRVDRYSMVNDFGVMINPLLVEGQAQGGVVQGLGQALMELVIYDESGQLLTGSYTDYAMPRAEDMPELRFASHPVPATTNPLGAKGCGEAGCAGALPSIMNAAVDALSKYGIMHMDMPATAPRVWQAIREKAPAL